MEKYDVVIVGGGPAGLSAALVLSRGRKRVLLCDAGTPRNAAAVGVHNFITRDGISPRDFRAAGRAEIEKYGAATFLEARVVDVRPHSGPELAFDVSLEDGTRVVARRVILASGMVDEPPEIPGLREQWGRSIFQCPYCHGWEVRERPWGVLAESDAMAEHALLMLGWTDRLTVFTNGKTIAPEILSRLANAGAAVAAAPIERIVSRADGAHLDCIELRDGTKHTCDVLVMRPQQRPTELVVQMKLVLDDNGFVKVDDKKESSIPGVYVAGDASTMMQAAVIAAGAGMMAGASANFSLVVEAALARGATLEA